MPVNLLSCLQEFQKAISSTSTSETFSCQKVMSSLGDESSPVVDHAKWLKQFGSWNAKRTKATTTIFAVPNNMICDIAKNGSMGAPVAISSVYTQNDIEDRGRTCRACNLIFLEQHEQQQHFKTELHRINLKRNLAGLDSIAQICGTSDDNANGCISLDGVKGVHFADEKEAGGSSSDEEEDVDYIYSSADYFEEANEEVTDAGRYPTEYVTEQGTVCRYLSKQDGPQYVFSSNRESLSTWDFTVSIGALHEASSVNAFEVQPWALLSDTVRRLQGYYQLR